MKSKPIKNGGLSDIWVTIIAAAYDIIKSFGCSALSIRKIGQEASCSVPAIYRYFGSKSGILTALRIKGFTLLSVRILAAKKKYNNPTDQLTGMFYAYWKFAVDEWQLYQLMFNDRFSAPGAPVFNGGTVAEKAVKESIREACLPYIADDQCINQKFYTIWAALHGLTFINRDCRLTGGLKAELILEDIRKVFLEPVHNFRCLTGRALTPNNNIS